MEPCKTFDEVCEEWEKIVDEVLTFRETYIDNYKPVTPPHDFLDEVIKI